MSWDVLVYACCPGVAINGTLFQNYLRATVKVPLNVRGIEMVESREKSVCFPRVDTCAG